MEFEWDPAKALRNERTHGVSFFEANTVFDDPYSLTRPDRAHSYNEERFVTLGLSDAGRILVVVHSERGTAIRIISARRATSHERNRYEHSPS